MIGSTGPSVAGPGLSLQDAPRLAVCSQVSSCGAQIAVNDPTLSPNTVQLIPEGWKGAAAADGCQEMPWVWVWTQWLFTLRSGAFLCT